MTAIDAQFFRRVLGHYPTGVCVVTALVDDRPIGMVIGSFTSLSLDPPLVAFMPEKTSSTYAKLERAKSFIANVLSNDQEQVCRTLMMKKERDPWQDLTWHPGHNGAPVLKDAVAWVECDVETRYEGGDHWIVVGKVTDCEAPDGEHLPLLFFQGGYGRFSPASFIAPTELDLLPQLERADRVRGVLERVSQESGLESAILALADTNVVIVARAGGRPGEDVRRSVGTRFPFTPPVGSLFCAWDDNAFDLWSRQLTAPNEEAMEDLREMVATVRERGWSASFRSADNRELERLLKEYSRGRYTPAMERQLQSLVTSTRAYIDPVELDVAQDHPVFTLSAPVFGPDGSVVLVTQLVGPRVPAGTEQFERWRDLIVAAADEMTTLLASPNLDATIG